jgi:hypothetical protein
VPDGKLAGGDLAIGGKGLKNLYDKVYPALMNDIPAVKAAGVKVETGPVGLGPESKFLSMTVKADEEAVLRALTRKFADGLPLDDILDTVSIEEDEEEGPQSLSYLHGDLIRDELEQNYNYDDAADASEPEDLARAVMNILQNRGYDTDTWWLDLDPALQVPGVDMTPALREAVLGGQPMFQGAQGATEFTVDARPSSGASRGANFSTAAHSSSTSRGGSVSIVPWLRRRARDLGRH